jgi:hypothetical protein
MNEITLSLPISIQVGGPAGHERNMSTALWNADFLLEMALHGIKQRRTDKFSVQKATKGLDDAIKGLLELDARLIAGEIPAGGGGGGPRQSPETKGWLAYFKSAKHQEGSKAVTSDTLERAKDSYVRTGLLRSLKDKALEQAKQDIRPFMAKYRQVILDQAEKRRDKGQPGWFIQKELESRNVTEIAEFDLDIKA